ncbi:GNAT family N-acetyltransferase [uncultured Roseibium sp.]|uniref:GNAT family N-acetyltransferase n=1 Tax=uncultured Roseibium sp. TaxID=1936171 RepID=UPI00262A6D9D|nr:GNAT family N-acetyltransferase [uncultured Roseibium sp.]
MKADVEMSAPLEAVSFDPLSRDLPVDAWKALARNALDPNPFFSPEFLRPFLKNLKVKGLRLATVRNKRSGDWLLSCPVGHGPAGLAVPIAKVWTSDYAPLGTPLMHQDAGPEHVDLFFKASSGPLGVLALPFLPLASATAERLQAPDRLATAIYSRSRRAAHASGPEGEAQLADAFKGKRRKEMRRLLRKLEEHGDVSFESITGPKVGEHFDAFLKLEAGGWKGRGQTALASNAQTVHFSQDAIAAFSRSGSIRIDELRAGDRLIASIVCFVQNGHVLTWKIAFDEEFGRYSPGAQLVLFTFRENLALPDFKFADSLAIPGHPMIEPLWRGRLETGTLILSAQPLAEAKIQLCGADLALERNLRNVARAARARFRFP